MISLYRKAVAGGFGQPNEADFGPRKDAKEAKGRFARWWRGSTDFADWRRRLWMGPASPYLREGGRHTGIGRRRTRTVVAGKLYGDRSRRHHDPGRLARLICRSRESRKSRWNRLITCITYPRLRHFSAITRQGLPGQSAQSLPN
jgi:hypothetical protein